MQNKKEISVPGWRGTGYMVIDPTNGNGAFLIGGGGNGGWVSIGISVILDLIKSYTIPVAIVSLLYSILSNLKKLQECVANGNYFAAAAFLVITIAFIAFMTYMTSMALLGGVGLIYIAMSSTAMETMNADMSSALLETC